MDQKIHKFLLLFGLFFLVGSIQSAFAENTCSESDCKITISFADGGEILTNSADAVITFGESGVLNLGIDGEILLGENGIINGATEELLMSEQK